MVTNTVWRGFAYDDGTPVLRISILGSNGYSLEFEAIIDTGFNGFLSIPQRDADALGLKPITTERVFFADNSEHIRWTSVAKVTVDDEHQVGMVYLEPSSEEVLLGMEFIRKFDRMFLVYPTDCFVHFINSPEAKELIKVLAQ